jgi:hypothetical protein
MVQYGELHLLRGKGTLKVLKAPRQNRNMLLLKVGLTYCGVLEREENKVMGKGLI